MAGEHMQHSIGVLSDTHANYTAALQAARQMTKVDMLVHLGDNTGDGLRLSRELQREIFIVRGNCDPSSPEPPTLLLELGGWRIFAAHGHMHGVKFSLDRLAMAAREHNAQIVLFGHTHVSQVLYEQGIYFINPGSTSEPRGGNGASFAIIHLTEEKVTPQIIRLRWA